jgi:hypothetical protein
MLPVNNKSNRKDRKMMYEEFKELTKRADVSIELYEQAVEPLYMDGYTGTDKAEFCKMIKAMPVEVLQMMAKCHSIHMQLVDEANELQEAVQREKAKVEESSAQANQSAKRSGELALELNRTHLDIHTLELRVMFAPESTLRDLRAANFENYPIFRHEAEAMGIVEH